MLATIIKKDSRDLCTFVLNKSFRELSDISRKNFIFLKMSHSEFSHIKVWFTEPNSEQLEIEDKINSTLVIN